jgi:hypothetical protein
VVDDDNGLASSRRPAGEVTSAKSGPSWTLTPPPPPGHSGNRVPPLIAAVLLTRLVRGRLHRTVGAFAYSVTGGLAMAAILQFWLGSVSGTTSRTRAPSPCPSRPRR